jgi:small subunit ribosomal protein S1
MSLDVNKPQPAADKSSQQEAPATQEDITAAGSEARDDENSFEKLLEAYEGRTQSFSEGEVIKGRVIAISGNGVIVDVGFKSEGIIPVEQFTNDRGQITIKPGDSIDVFLEQTEDSNGYVVLSREKAERMKIWDEIERAFREGTVVKGRVIERIKGGWLWTSVCVHFSPDPRLMFDPCAIWTAFAAKSSRCA